jgi:hypothetical protein
MSDNIHPARIGRLTMGEIESIHLHEGGPAAAALLTRYWNSPSRVRYLIDHGDILRLGNEYPTNAYGGQRPIVHADNAWPNDNARCLYLYQQDTWWVRDLNPNGTWPPDWKPLDAT